MEAMKTSGKTIRRGAPIAPIKGGKAGLGFDSLRAIRGHLIRYRDILIELDGSAVRAYDVDIRIDEINLALKEVA